MTRALLTLGCLIVFCGLASAQEYAAVIEPGQLEKRFERQKIPETPPQTIFVPPARQERPLVQTDQIRFVLSSIEIRGATQYTESEFFSLYQGTLNQQISLSEIYQLAEAITAKYRNDGFILSRALVPVQRIKDGIVHLRVIEGYVNQVIIEEKSKTPSRLLAQYGEKIRQSRPLKAKVLERYLLLANDLPGITARAIFSPTEKQTGAADLTIVIEKDAIESFSLVDNRGSRFVGPNQIQAGFAINGFLGRSHRTQIRAITASQESELQFFELEHSLQIDDKGTSAIVALRNTDSEPGSQLQVLDINTDSVSSDVTLVHPFIRSRAHNLAGRLAFSYRDSESDILGTPLSEDRLRSLRFGLSYDFVNSKGGVTFVDAEISQGLNILNARQSGSINLSRKDGVSDYTKLSLEVLRLERFAKNWSMLFGVKVQYAANPLLASEQFALGGANYGRAYDPSELVGDHGKAAKIELQYDRRQLFTDLPLSLQLYSYYDLGSVKDRQTNTTASRKESLSSIGIGTRFNYAEWLSGSLEFSKPLTRNVVAEGADGDQARLFFSLTGRF